jgi:hypothetical protein
MNYTAKQIENAKRKYTNFLRPVTAYNFQIEVIGMNEAESRAEYHNSIVAKINAGDKELEKEWKLFFLKEEVKADAKASASREKLQANKEASADVLEPIKSLKKIGEFGKWLNNSKNPFRKEHFSKKYTQASVTAFLATL